VRLAINDTTIEKNEEIVTKWKENQPPSYYGGGTPNDSYYRFQAVERDAFDYAEDIIAKNFSKQKGEETFCDIYLSNMHKRKEIVEELAEIDSLLGPDYQNKIDKNVHDDYQKRQTMEQVGNQNVTEKRIDSDVATVQPIKIGDLRMKLNSRISESNEQQAVINRERDLIMGDPLTKKKKKKWQPLTI